MLLRLLAQRVDLGPGLVDEYAGLLLGLAAHPHSISRGLTDQLLRLARGTRRGLECTCLGGLDRFGRAGEQLLMARLSGTEDGRRGGRGDLGRAQLVEPEELLEAEGRDGCLHRPPSGLRRLRGQERHLGSSSDGAHGGSRGCGLGLFPPDRPCVPSLTTAGATVLLRVLSIVLPEVPRPVRPRARTAPGPRGGLCPRSPSVRVSMWERRMGPFRSAS